MYGGKVLVIASPAIEGYLENGIPYGSMSGFIYGEMPWFMKQKFVLPPIVFSIEDYDLKYLVIAVLSLSVDNITNMTSANPSTFLKLLDVINERKEVIIKLIRSGSFSELEGLNESEKNELEKYFSKNKHRAQELEELFKIHPRVTYEHLFKNLQVISTWLAGSCGALIPMLKRNVSATTHVIEVGYLASEFRGSINIDVINNRTIPAFHETFLEFAEKNDYEAGVIELQSLEEIEQGKQYYIFITTGGGLYRYNMNDLIEVTGLYNRTPTIVFVQKGKGTTNITGEKLYESQVIKAVGSLGEDVIEDIKFFMMIADENELKYSLYIEGKPTGGTAAGLANMIDGLLMSMNIEYEAKRKSGRLKLPEVFFLKQGSGEAYKKHEVEKGMRENQFKTQPLLYKRDVTFKIEEYTV
jgi:hypothetical protein